MTTGRPDAIRGGRHSEPYERAAGRVRMSGNWGCTENPIRREAVPVYKISLIQTTIAPPSIASNRVSKFSMHRARGPRCRP